MKVFNTYKEAFNFAVNQSRELNIDSGLEKKKEFGKTIFAVSLLPKKENTFGSERLKQRITKEEPLMA